MRIEFVNDKIIEEDDNSLTLLQISLKHNIPHMHVCGGNGKCSTCRVMVLENPQNLSPSTPLEASLAKRKGLEHNIRLACQTRVNGPVKLRRLVIDDADADLAVSNSKTSGRETKLAILFSDIRSFTQFTEIHLPYDAVHILNRYFYRMGEVVLSNHGYIDKFIGDGMMALFGLNDPCMICNCVNAVKAATQMLSELADLNIYLQRQFNVSLQIGIGVHYGEVILGEIGHPKKMPLTAIGDAVNITSRIEAATKEAKRPLLVSSQVRHFTEPYFHYGDSFSMELKGKSGQFLLHEVREFLHISHCNSFAADNLHNSEEVIHFIENRLSLPLAPQFLRLAFHDAGTWDKQKDDGGANGSIRLREELQRDENRGLSSVIGMIQLFKENFPQYSWSDLIALAGAIAVGKAGGPEIKITLGRIDSQVPSPTGRILASDATLEQVLTRFADMDFTPQEMVSLNGSHTLGKINGYPLTDDFLTFSNSYFKLLVQADPQRLAVFLPYERELSQHPLTQEFILLYALDQERFFQDFTLAYQKLSTCGARFSSTVQ